jgi:hypothetical protein
MFLKFKEAEHRSDFELVVNWKEIIKGIESNIILKNHSDSEEEEEPREGENKSHSEDPLEERG